MKYFYVLYNNQYYDEHIASAHLRYTRTLRYLHTLRITTLLTSCLSHTVPVLSDKHDKI